MTTRGQDFWRCPHCGQVDQQVFSRRRLRVEDLPSRVGRREGVKSRGATRPRVRLAELVKRARAQHEASCEARD